MPVRNTTQIEAVTGGPNQRVYIPQKFRVQHDYPFRPGESVALQLVETSDGRPVVVMTKETIQVDEEITEITLERSTSDIQSNLEGLEGGQ